MTGKHYNYELYRLWLNHQELVPQYLRRDWRDWATGSGIGLFDRGL